MGGGGGGGKVLVYCMYCVCVAQQRERDLELAARIGRSLLQRNELLETELGSQLDHRQQLEQQVCVCIMYGEGVACA